MFTSPAALFRIVLIGLGCFAACTSSSFAGYRLSTFAGAGINPQGSVDGKNKSASFFGPSDVAIDGSGNLFVADTDNNKIRKISPTGDVSTFAGTGQAGNTDGNSINATFYRPKGVAVDVVGNVYVADTGNHKIRKITPAGEVSTFAGSGNPGSTDGNGVTASFNTPIGVAVDATGNIYVGDSYNHKIRKITPTADVLTFAGSGNHGSVDDNGINASFHRPKGIAVDAAGNIYVADSENRKIRKITPTGDVSTFAAIHSAIDVTVDINGNVYVVDFLLHSIRKISPAGKVSTLAGSGGSGIINATGSAAYFAYPEGIAVQSDGTVYVAESGRLLRRVSSPR